MSTKDPLKFNTSKTYDAIGHLVRETDANGNVLTVTDEEGYVVSYVYDKDGRMTQLTNARGFKTAYAYDKVGNLVRVTNAMDGVTAYVYDKNGNLLSETNTDGGVTRYTYDGLDRITQRTDEEGGVTTYEYDPLDRLIKTTTPDGKSEHITYNGEGDVTSKTDKAGHKTSYVLDACGRIVETIDALGNSTLFEYDPMGRLTKTSLHRVDAQDKVDEWEITLYEYDGRGLVTKETNALGAVTAYAYDGNGNLVSKKDADGYETKYTYNALDFVTQINYNGGKQASYRYNKVGELVEMEDWTGTTSFEVDLLRRITQVTDRKGNVVEYTYDEVGNQTSIDYPDGTGVDYTYDLLHQLKTVTEDDGRATAYSYDGMGRVVKMEYPHGWVGDYVYDSIGQLLRVDDTDPTQKDLKQQKHVYKYDDCGNMIYEYMRGNGTGEATTENTYAYDALHRIIRSDEVYGKAWREYQYDSLGNLTYESNSNNVHYDYKLNDLNQITQKTYSSNDKEGTLYTYDNRGNLVLEQYGKLNGNGNNNGNGQRSTVGQYTYDETNKMVLGVNSSGESSAYLYNGLGALVEDTWKIAKNGYGYHDVDAGLGDADPNNGRGGGGSNGQGNGNGNGQGNGNGSGDKPTGSLVTNFSTVVKEFVVDYTSPTFEPLMEHEVNGLDYRYVYGNDRLSVNITGVETSSGNLIENGNQIRLYYHMDYLGTADYLTSPVTGKVESWTHYNEWGEITHNAVLKTGKRELDLVKRYATHDYDAVLGMYYAKARFYDAENRRFAAMDPVKGEITNPLTMVQYLYVIDNPLRWIDLLGKYYIRKIANGDYIATPASEGVASVATMFGSFVPTAGGYIESTIKLFESSDAVGGNSDGPWKNAANYGKNKFDNLKGDVTDKLIKDTFGKVIADSANTISNIAGALDFWNSLDDALKIPAMDSVCFKLFELASILPRGDSIAKVDYIMHLAYAFVQAYSWFFTIPAYHTGHKDVWGNVFSAPGPTMFQILTNLKAWSDDNKPNKVKQESSRYWQEFRCGMRTNDILNNIYKLYQTVREGTPIIFANPPMVWRSELYYKYAIDHYKSELNSIVSLFKNYMEAEMKLVN